MLSAGAFTFLSPWILSALVAVPLLWWLLRVMPPRPKTVSFGAFFILKGLQSTIKTAATTPWWLLLLRCLVVVFFVLALAEPVEKLSGDLPGKGGSVLIVVDNGWSAAFGWKERMAKLQEYLPRIERGGRSVIFIPTAPASGDGKLRSFGPMEVSEAKEWAERLSPEAWPADYRKTLEAVTETLEKSPVSHSLFFSAGLRTGPELPEMLQERGRGLTLLEGGDINNPYILKQTSPKPTDLVFSIARLKGMEADIPMALVAYSDAGNVLDEMKFTYPAGKTSFEVTWPMLPEVRHELARVDLRGVAAASTVFLADFRWRQRPVGVISDPSRNPAASFLNEVYYLKRALEENGVVTVETPENLLKKNLSALIWPDSAPLTAEERVPLLDWVRQGGFLIRFAGPNLAAGTDDPLLPVVLRSGQRSMQGAMTWETPARLGDALEHSPLKGLAIPPDVTVRRQVLSNPSPETFERTWLGLEDGTPLVTGAAMEKGFVVLVHTTAGPDWSDFCYSGLYVEALQRMIALSTGIGDYKGQARLLPLKIMNGFGRLDTPAANSIASSVDPAGGFYPAPETPPGLYGDRQQYKVYNLGDYLPPMAPFADLPDGAAQESYHLSGERSLKGDLLKIALFLLMLDTLATLWLQGILSFSTRAAAGLFFVISLSLPVAARAEGETGVDLASGIYLAYVETGDEETDRLSYNGLSGLAEVINTRTTIEVKGVKGVDPSIDALHFYPFLYWPMTGAGSALSGVAARNIQNYLGEGGMILFDTRDARFGGGDDAIGAGKLRELTQNIRIPELAEVGQDHILTRSFYLLDDFPGRYTGGKTWVEKEPDTAHDGVTSVVIGANEWASAWSADPDDRARYSVEPGGERQREMAYRFGVNLAMAALTGNYKADQVHIPHILERLQR